MLPLTRWHGYRLRVTPPQQQQFQGTAGPVSAEKSRRLDIALQHIHEGYVTFQVQRASHTPAASENSGLVIDYDSLKVRLVAGASEGRAGASLLMAPHVIRNRRRDGPLSV